MKKLYARMLSASIATAMIISVMSGCGGGEKKNDTAKDQGQSSQQTGTKIVSSPLTLTMFAQFPSKAQGLIKSSNEIAAYQELEKRTGIHIEFQQPPIGQEKDQFNLMVASNELPDMIWYDWSSVPGGPAKALKNQTIIKLNDSIEKNAPNLKKVFEKYPEAKKDSMLDDSSYYMMPWLKPDKTVRTVKGFQIRKDWLDKLGLKTPTTIDEWHTVLKAFKEKDPNGNGKNDEIPFISTKQDQRDNFTHFTSAWGLINDFYNDNGTIKYGPVQPAYKEFLTTMRQWYQEGLIDSEFALNDQKQFDAKVTNNIAGSLWGLAAGNLGKYMNTMVTKQPTFELAAVPFPKGPSGKSYNTFCDQLMTGKGIAITSANKHVAESIKWCDYQYSEEGNLLMNFGVEGESYTMVNGKPTLTDTIFKSPKGYTPDQAIALYATTGGSSMVYDTNYYEQILTLPQQKDAIKTWAQGDLSLQMPALTPSAEDTTKLASIMNEINTYRDEMIFKFVMGQEPIENFDKYVQKIKGMKLDDALKIEQDALQRYNARK